MAYRGAKGLSDGREFQPEPSKVRDPVAVMDLGGATLQTLWLENASTWVGERELPLLPSQLGSAHTSPCCPTQRIRIRDQWIFSQKSLLRPLPAMEHT